MRNIPFSPPDVDEKEIEEIVKVIKSGWITTGPKTKEFEHAIGDYLGNNNVVCLNSQTACAEMALRLLEIGPGDEVIVPAYTYTATASVVCHVGAKLVLADCSHKEDFQLDYDNLEDLINENTKAVILVDFGGVPCDYDKVYEVVERKKTVFKAKGRLQKALGRVAVLSDAAHAFGAYYKDKKSGNYADFTSISFHAVKNLTTAEGGALVWKSIEGVNDEDIYKQLQLFSLHGQSKDAFAKTQMGAWEYDIKGTWYKCNMTSISAAMGLAQLKKYDEFLEKRKRIIETYNKVLCPLGIKVLTHFTDLSTSSGHLYITRIPGIDETKRGEIIEKMAQAGVATNVHYKPLPMFSAYKEMGFDIKDFPNAYDLYSNEITLPLHTKLSQVDVEYVLEKYVQIVKEYI